MPKFLATLVLIFFAIFGMTHLHTGHGQRNGTIVKLAQEGVINTTWEVEIIRGGINAGQGGFGVKPFYATISDPSLLPVLQSAFDKQQEIQLTYDEFFWTPLASECRGQGENCAFVSQVVIKESK